MAESPKASRFASRLLVLPIVALVALLALEYFSPSKKAPKDAAPASAQTQEAPAPTTAQSVGARNVHAESKATGQLETERYIAKFSDLNGALLHFQLKETRYQDHNGHSYQLVTTDKENYLPLVFDITGIAVPADARWTLETQDADRVVYVLNTERVRLRRTWIAEPRSYGLSSTLELENLTEAPFEVTPNLRTAHYVKHSEENTGFIGRPSTQRSEGLCRAGGELVRAPSKDLLEHSETQSAKVSYVGTANVYFATLIVPEGNTAGCTLAASERGGSVKEPDGILFESSVTYRPITLAPHQPTTINARAYLGPKKLDALQAFDPVTTDAVNLGWFSWIAEALVWLLAKIHAFVGNWGLAIIALTFLVKLALYPLTEKSFRSMARMRVLKPEMDRINELYGDDREKKGAAIMELYRKHKINPLGGCLPTLLQMPIWFALYQSLSTNIELYHAPFTMWWGDLSGPDPYFALPLLVGGLMFVQQKLTPTTMDPVQTKVMLYVMPIMFTAFMLFLPSGLCLYIATNSILGIAQQKFVNYRIEHPKNSSDDQGNSSPPVVAEVSATANKG